MVDFTSQQIQTHQGIDKAKFFPLFALCSLFFLWGFITVLNDILVPQLKANFDLNYTQAMLIQFCFFMAYFAVSIPSGYLIRRIGYKAGLQIGLVISAIGCFLFYPATQFHTYPLFLAALFVVASGIAMMQVSANPYVSALGPSDTASSRLSFAASCNSLGTTLGPHFGALLILTATFISGASALQTPYLILGTILLIFAAAFHFVELPRIEDIETTQPSKTKMLLKAPHLYLGAWGIFFYVGAEVSLGSFMINYLSDDAGALMTETQAAHLLSFFWGGAMLGRIIGAFVMRFVNDKKVLAAHASLAILFLIITMNTTGSLAVTSVLAVGLCNSIMFPTIFSVAIYELRELTSKASGILCTAIVGGAVIPLLQGALADMIGIKSSFVIPMLCYVYILTYALRSQKLQNSWLHKKEFEAATSMT